MCGGWGPVFNRVTSFEMKIRGRGGDFISPPQAPEIRIAGSTIEYDRNLAIEEPFYSVKLMLVSYSKNGTKWPPCEGLLTLYIVPQPSCMVHSFDNILLLVQCW